MKRILHLLFAILIVSCGSKSHVARHDDGKYPINGNVSSIKIITYEAISRFGEAHKADEDDYEDYTLINFDKDGNIDSSFSYWYSSYDKCDKLSSYITYDYSDGRIASLTIFNSLREAETKIVWTYLSDQLSRIDEFDANGKLKTFNRYEYLEDGSVIINSFSSDSTLLSRSISTPSEASYHKAVVSLPADDEITTVSLSKGNQLLAVYDGKYERTASYNSNGDVERCEGFRLSPDGRSFMNSDEDVPYIYKYQYDSKKNWVKRVCYEGAARQPIEITERFIEYAD